MRTVVRSGGVARIYAMGDDYGKEAKKGELFVQYLSTRRVAQLQRLGGDGDYEGWIT
jgi:hypothetical protein